MNVLFIATRAPYGRMHGHKMGIRTYLGALKGSGFNVTLAAFDVPGDPPVPEDLGIKTYLLRLPSKWRVFSRVLTQWLPRKLSINECLYLSEAANDRIKEIVSAHKIDFVVADMIRTAPYAENTGLPWFLDHEDLLSERYEMWAGRASGNENILGYLENTIPSFLRPLARSVFRLVMRRESRILEKRELYWTDRTLASSLRSLEETERLQARTKRRVFCMPVTVPVPSKPVDALEARPVSAVFTGGLTYQPNLDALRAYVQQILPEFERRSIEPPILRVIGAAPDDLRIPLEHKYIEFLGYVPDLDAELSKAQVFFAPIVSGTGIKTKVLEALAYGLPLVALTGGLTGLQGKDGQDFLGARNAAEFVDQYLRVRDEPGLAASLGRMGRDLAIRAYSIEAATRLLGAEIASLVPAATPIEAGAKVSAEAGTGAG